MLVLGGGGYTMRNVARCWCYETGKLLDKDLEDDLPESSYAHYDYYMDTHKLRIEVSNMRNSNTRAQLEELKVSILEQLKDLPPAPSAPMVQKPPKQEVEDDLPEEDADVRGGGQAYEDRRVVKDEDGYVSGDDGVGNEGAARGDAVKIEPAMPAMDEDDIVIALSGSQDDDQDANMEDDAAH
eukprot:jgi/Picre1/32922/NNA_008251.t1